MFASTTQDHISASVLAGLHLRAWEKALALRVSIQKPLDLANRLPAEFAVSKDSKDETSENLIGLTNQLKRQVYDVADLLSSEVQRSSGQAVKSKSVRSETADIHTLWDDLYSAQTQLQTTRWEPILNKWHARLNFGSEKTKSKLKVFTQTMWNQVGLTTAADTSLLPF